MKDCVNTRSLIMENDKGLRKLRNEIGKYCLAGTKGFPSPN